MKEVNLSIIIPNYNKGMFIAKTIDSILSQTAKPREIIIVDDCSTDNSREIIDKYKDKHMVIAYYLEHNFGVQYARNYGASMATSEYLCFIDSDDIYLRDDVIELEMAVADKKSIVGVYALFIDYLGNIISKPHSKKEKKVFKRHLLYHVYNLNNYILWPYFYIVPSNVFKRVGMYNFKYNLNEDSDLMMRLILSNIKVKYVDIEGKGYRVGNDANHLSHAKPSVYEEVGNYYKQLYKDRLPFSTVLFIHFVNFRQLIKKILIKLHCYKKRT